MRGSKESREAKIKYAKKWWGREERKEEKESAFVHGAEKEEWAYMARSIRTSKDARRP
jgi:hypothetical protein